VGGGGQRRFKGGHLIGITGSFGGAGKRGEGIVFTQAGGHGNVRFRGRVDGMTFILLGYVYEQREPWDQICEKLSVGDRLHKRPAGDITGSLYPWRDSFSCITEKRKRGEEKGSCLKGNGAKKTSPGENLQAA